MSLRPRSRVRGRVELQAPSSIRGRLELQDRAVSVRCPNLSPEAASEEGWSFRAGAVSREP